MEADPFAVAATMTTSWRLLEDDKKYLQLQEIQKFTTDCWIMFRTMHFLSSFLQKPKGTMSNNILNINLPCSVLLYSNFKLLSQSVEFLA